MKFYTNVSKLGKLIYHRGYNEDGSSFSNLENFKPYLFIKKEDKKSLFRTLDNSSVVKKEFNDINEQYTYLKQYKDVHNFEIYGTKNIVTTFIYDNYSNKPEINFNSSLIKIAIIDIECDGLINSDDFIEMAPAAITSISMKINNQLFAFGLKDFKSPEGVKYFKCSNEKVLLKTFLTIWEGINPDVVSGWNIVNFDIPYLINRIKLLLSRDDASRLSPCKTLKEREFRDRFGVQKTYDIIGISILDYLEIYKKFTLQVHGKLESYSLNFVSYFELNEKKLDYSEFGSLPELYEKNFQKFIEYNIHDVELIDRLDNKLKFFELIFEIAYLAKCNFQDVLKSIPVWDSLIHSYLRDRKIVVPLETKHHLTSSIPGGFVKEPRPGMYDWVVSFDVSAMYPTSIVQNNISPEKIITKKMLIDMLNEENKSE